jgi:hypothetical protein
MKTKKERPAPVEQPGTQRTSTPTILPELSDHGNGPVRVKNASLLAALLPPELAGDPIVTEPVVAEFDKPPKQVWFRVHPTIIYEMATFKAAGDRGDRLVAHSKNLELRSFLIQRGAWTPTRVYPYITRDKLIGFWPVATSSTNGRVLDKWSQAAHKIAENARELWVSLHIAVGGAGYEQADLPVGVTIPEPEWPQPEDVKLKDLLSAVLDTLLVENLDHPEMRRWRGL